MAQKSREYIEKLEKALTKEDWQYIAHATQDRFIKARPKKGEPQGSKDFEEQEKRIMYFLNNKAFS